MKKTILLFLTLNSVLSFGQCFTYIGIINPDCDSLCVGSAIANNNTSFYPVTYLWSTGDTSHIANGLCAEGHYSVTITDANLCTSVDSIIMNWPLRFNVGYIQPSCSSCCDGKAFVDFTNFSACALPISYNWQPGNSYNDTIYNLCVGNYTLCITDACGCIKCETVNLNYTNRLNEENMSTVFVRPKFYVNLNEVFIEINSEYNQGELFIYDLQGNKQVEKKLTFEKRYSINCSELVSGIYFISLQLDSKIYREKIIINTR